MVRLSLREVQLMQLELMKEVDSVCRKHNITYYLIAGSCLGAVRHGGFIPWDDDIDIAMMRSDYNRFASIFNKEFDLHKYFLQNYDSDRQFSPALSRICIKGTFVDLKSERHLKTCKNTYIDVFPLDNVPDDEKSRKLHKDRLRILDRLIGLKQYHLYRNTIWERITKSFVSLLLCVLPLRYLQLRRVKEMTRYSSVDTKCVCSTVSKYGYDRQVMDRKIYGVPARIVFEVIEVNVPEYTSEYLQLLYGNNYMQIPPKNKRVQPQTVYKLDRV